MNCDSLVDPTSEKTLVRAASLPLPPEVHTSRTYREDLRRLRSYRRRRLVDSGPGHVPDDHRYLGWLDLSGVVLPLVKFAAESFRI